MASPEDTLKGKIADSIILKVGHGIMTIPRNIEKKGPADGFSCSKGNPSSTRSISAVKI